MKGSLTPTTSTAFDTTQNEVWTGNVNAVASQQVSLGIRVFAPYQEAQQLYGLPGQPGDFVIFNQPWVSTQTDTAAALMAQLNASTYIVNSGLQLASPIELKDLITGASTGSGNFTITADQPYIVIEVSLLARATCSKTLSGYDMDTDPREAIVLATVSGGDVRYLETGQAPTATDGLLVVETNPFDVIGKTNILNARLIEADGANPATVNYEIYVG